VEFFKIKNHLYLHATKKQIPDKDAGKMEQEKFEVELPGNREHLKIKDAKTVQFTGY
jgi:hypothetical protein